VPITPKFTRGSPGVCILVYGDINKVFCQVFCRVFLDGEKNLRLFEERHLFSLVFVV
jgi:hypothetical protein